jgi:hypothetical protein
MISLLDGMISYHRVVYVCAVFVEAGDARIVFRPMHCETQDGVMDVDLAVRLSPHRVHGRVRS